MIVEDYFTTATALQRHEANVIRTYRRYVAGLLRDEADGYDLRALSKVEPYERDELTWIAYGLRIAAAKLDVPEEVVQELMA